MDSRGEALPTLRSKETVVNTHIICTQITYYIYISSAQDPNVQLFSDFHSEFPKPVFGPLYYHFRRFLLHLGLFEVVFNRETHAISSKMTTAADFMVIFKPNKLNADRSIKNEGYKKKLAEVDNW